VSGPRVIHSSGFKALLKYLLRKTNIYNDMKLKDEARWTQIVRRDSQPLQVYRDL